ncbi:MAG: DNA topoisomerase III, partial [Anaerotignum sp.]|nr:DNA topoisomerase III [Anaerotignum sp.]
RADWLVGINFTRLFTILYKQRLTVGRVQTPTLAMLVEREARITAFKKEKYYIVHASDGQIDAVSEHITDKAAALNIAENCKGKFLEVISVEQEEKVVKPPKLFDLTTLQRDANRLLGFTAQQALEYIQALYEKKLVTYPRTDSQYLTEDMGQTALDVINICRNRFCDEEEICVAGIKNLMDNKKVSDHHAIIPTVEVERSNLDSLPKGERQILLLVIYRLLCAVGQPQRFQTVKAVMNCGAVSFTASGKEKLQQGWKQLDTRLKNALGCKEEAEKTVILPSLEKGMHLDQMQYRISEHDTVPPKRYTEDTLLSAMENAGTEEITEDAERKGLGTPATRAAIIEKLVGGGMAERKGKQLIPTEKGIQLIAILPENVKSPKMTAEWENDLTMIAKGKKSADVFMDGIKSLVRNIVSEQQNRDETIYIGNMKCIGNCPKCGAEVYKSDQKYFCKDQKCGFVLYGNNRYFQSMRKELTEEEVTELLKEGRVKVNGLYSQKKKQLFAAIVCMDVSDKYPQFHLEFENTNQEEKGWICRKNADRISCKSNRVQGG